MSRPVRSLARLIVGMFALVWMGLGGAAFATVPPPDPAVTSAVKTLSVSSAHPSSSGTALWVVLLIAAGAVALGVALTDIARRIRRHRPVSQATTA